jgi:DNA-binding response OmpR family regulator
VLHLLVIEDNPGDVLLIREAVRGASVAADVMIAYDGEQALRMLLHDDVTPDFIFLDLNLPKHHGMEILKLYHATERPPWVVLTSSSNPQDRKRALELGAREYIVKPMDLEEYIATVRESFERWIPEPA